MLIFACQYLACFSSASFAPAPAIKNHWGNWVQSATLEKGLHHIPFVVVISLKLQLVRTASAIISSVAMFHKAWMRATCCVSFELP